MVTGQDIINTQDNDNREYLKLSHSKCFSWALFAQGKTEKNWLLMAVSNHRLPSPNVTLITKLVDLAKVKI
jgi:hypothetical protein